MDTQTKRSCIRNEEKTLDTNHNDEKDIISNLPDCVLAHILSKLPTKFAVGTSILSTRWKHLFALIPQPQLEFDDSLFLRPENLETSNSADRLASFANFTCRVLDVILKEVPVIFTFILKCTEVYEDEQILHWLNSALARDPMIIDVDLREDMNEPWIFYEFISEWASILYLALRNDIGVYLPDSFSLPNLKHLVLDRIRFPSDEDVSLILSGCPVLKNLTMRYLRLEDVDNLNISIPSLEYLSIEHCWYSGMESYSKVVIDTPALKYLYFEDHLPEELILNNLNSLRKAHISALPFENLDESLSLKDSKSVAALVRACSNVNKLFLSKDTISAFQKSSEELPTFCNLTKLQLGGFDINGWKLLPRLLEKAPELEILRITKEFHEEEGCFDIFSSHLSDKTIAPCLLSSLVKLEIFKLKGETDDGLLLISYFFYAGKVLNTVDITCKMPLENFDYLNKVLKGIAEKAGILGTCRITTRNIRL